jgi:predicted nucleic acid-binding protein
MRLALTDLFHAKWTQEIHKEWMRNLLKNRPDLTAERLELVKTKMDMHVRDCLVDGYQELINGIKLPDPNDRHVLAAAIKANAQIIVTYNISDFPSTDLSKFEIEAQHPDDFLRHLLDLAPAKVIATVQETRKSLKNPPKTSNEYLDILEKQSLPQTCTYLREYERLI